MPVSPSLAGAVLLAEPLAIRARRFRAVFVCGLGEGEFPMPGTSEPFLSDEHRRELAVASGLRLPATEDALARERYLFYACVSRATEQLVFSYRSSDEEGNLALPSPFIADAADLFVEGWFAARERRLLADVVWDPRAAPTDARAGTGRRGGARVGHRRAVAGACPGRAGAHPRPPSRRRLGQARLKPTRTVRSNGSWTASSHQPGLSPIQMRWFEAAICTRRSRRCWDASRAR